MTEPKPTDQKPTEIVTLGRPFHLGTLYDMRSDVIIAGATLWDQNILDTNRKTHRQPYTNYEIITGDSFQKKAYALGVEADLKLSLLVGMINVAGSAKYADDHQQTNHVTRLTLKYSTTTHFEELTMKHLGKGNLNYPDLHDANIATHVVTGVLYGAEAFFVFDHKLSENESKQEIQGTLEAVIKKIPKFKIQGKAELDLNDNEKYCVDNLCCKFYGDFNLKENPNTFEDAIELYRHLPSLLGENHEKAIPKKVWLYPLHLLDGKAPRIVRHISSRLIDSSIGIIENLYSLEVKALDLTKGSMFNYFNHMKDDLNTFAARLSEMQRELKQQIAMLLPKLRADTDTQESALFNVFKEIDSSPFNESKLKSWLDEKEKEIYFIGNFIENLTKDKSLDITVKSTSLDDIIGDIDYKYILCLSFCLNDENKFQLKDMYNYRYNKETFKFQTNREETPKWFKHRDIVNQTRADVRQFIEFAKANNNNGKKLKFIVNEEHSSDLNKPTKVTLYENGLEKKGFKIPSKPSELSAKFVTDDGITLKWNDEQNGTEKIKKYKIMYRISNENDEEEQWVEVFTNDDKKEISISKLPSKKKFIFKVQSVTTIGVSSMSDISEPIETLPKRPLTYLISIQSEVRDLNLSMTNSLENNLLKNCVVMMMIPIVL
ncbi:unnamed protein product [Adineta ricciae]|uniref:Fibronectin type-III domain-containing protein n=1 Tax=Adineta ricciae TaxID=249248 RepID=A0A814VJB5_ADIRI|nr:unnamed protein product [Adineta ricciae]